jgi:nicotinate-nucleotide adenylyltransferase
VRIGILGGTFDPIHLGHLAAARAAIDCAQLDRVLVLPAGKPPHRQAAVADAEHRLAMGRLAVEDDPRLEVSDVEIRRQGLSYTVDTLRELRLAYPGDEMFLILGWDAARMFATWHEPQKVQELAAIVVVTRPGSPQPDEEAIRAAGLDPWATILCVRPTPDISGSALRRAIANGEDVTDRLPGGVATYIAKNRLYMDNR